MTPKEIKKLSDEELRIKVAELLGWTEFGKKLIGLTAKTIIGAQSVLAATPPEDRGRTDCERGFEELPDYPADLNACHEMEKTLKLTGVQGTKYAGMLEELILGRAWPETHTGTDLIKLAHATARQRCEAFILTLEDK